MWEHLLVGAIIVLFWPLGSFACGLICFGMGIVNIPGFLLWKTSLTHGGFAKAGGLLLGWLGQMVVSMAFCAVLIVFLRWLPTVLHVSYLLIWILWAMAFLTALRPSFGVMKLPCDPDVADNVFVRNTSALTLTGTAIGFIVLALVMNYPTAPRNMSAEMQKEIDDTAAAVVNVLMAYQFDDPSDGARVANNKTAIRARVKQYDDAQLDAVCRAVDTYLAFQSAVDMQLADDFARANRPSKSAFSFNAQTRKLIDRMPQAVRAIVKPDSLEEDIDQAGRLLLQKQIELPADWREAAKKKRNEYWKTFDETYSDLLGRKMPTFPY